MDVRDAFSEAERDALGLNARPRGQDGRPGGAQTGKRTFATSDWGDPASIPPRRWLYGRHYIRGSIGCTVANGGTGKTSLLIAEAVAMAAGRDLVGVATPERLRVLYWNGEEPPDEIRRRVYAVCQRYQLDPAEALAGWLFIASGLERPINASNERGGLTELHWFLQDQPIDAVIVDPFVASHREKENDNAAIDAVAKRWAALANEKALSIDLVHHTRKPPIGDLNAYTANDSRGASALVDAARAVRILNAMTEAEAARANVKQHRAFFRLDAGKANYAPAEMAQWFHIVSELLPNGDDVGVVTPWQFPGALDNVSTAQMYEVRERARRGQYRADPRSDDWIGALVAEVVGLDPKTDAKRIKEILKVWMANGVLKTVERRDDNRHPRVFVDAGRFEEDAQCVRQSASRTGAQLARRSGPRALPPRASVALRRAIGRADD